jgi:seryl-tRNA synthetase
LIDLKLLRSEPDRIRDSLEKRGVDLDLDKIIRLDEEHRRLLGEVEKLRAEQNQASRAIAKAEGADRETAIASSKQLAERLKSGEAELDRIKSELDALLLEVPNLVHPSVPPGVGDENNVVLKEVGERLEFDFEAKDHLDLGEALGIIDIPRAAKISGTRFGILKGQGAVLELALMRYAMDFVTARGFVPIIPPVLVRNDAMFGTGFFPSEEEQAYAIERDDLYLVGTSEVPLASMHGDEILASGDLPLRYAGFSSCFRREAGTYGKDTRGIIRLHQFEKVEMFILCEASESDDHHAAILDIEEQIFQSLGIPYRVVDTCAGDLGAPYIRKFDLEAWLPGSHRWLEVTSCSNATDYQARRLRIRTKGGGSTAFVHTLNGTAAAAGRAIVALLENHQRPDGSVGIPEALRSHAGFEEIAVV